MKVLSVSFKTKKGVSAVTLSNKGYLLDKSVYKIHDVKILDSSYLCLIDTFITALRLTRQVLDKDSEYSRVVFEVNNTTFIKWIELGYSKDAYQDKFFEALTLLNELPIEYKFTYSKVPFASKYISQGVDKVQLTGLLDGEGI